VTAAEDTMRKISFSEALEQILQDDRRYHTEAYLFVKDALEFTVKTLGKPSQGPERHVTGKELVDGIRAYACQEYGPMAFRVLKSWGITRTLDFGCIVFNLIGKGIFGKTPQDKLEDFADGYDFRDAFIKPFLPSARHGRAKGHDEQTRGQKELALGNG
jgi:uncharacterized repeat protein (TIGR04138 family)